MSHLGLLRIPEKVGARYYSFGMCLLKDMSGEKLQKFRGECQGDARAIVRMIWKEWLEGKGVPVTWGALVDVLREIGIYDLADQIARS